MHVIKILRISILLLVFQLCSFPAMADVSQSRSPISISVKTDQPVITTLEQPVFTVTFQNISNHSVILYNTDVYWNWNSVFYKLGGTPETQGPWKLGFMIRGRVMALQSNKLKSGDKLDVRVDLNKLRNPAVAIDYMYIGVIKHLINPISHLNPGRYRMELTVTLNDHPNTASNDVWSGPGKAIPIEFTVVAAKSNTK